MENIHVQPQLLGDWSHLAKEEPAPAFVYKLWDALDCSTRGPPVAGFTINPLSTRQVLDFKAVVEAAPKHPRIGRKLKLVEFVRTNIVKHAMSFLGKMNYVETACTQKGPKGYRQIANMGKNKFDKLCDQNKTFDVDLKYFAAGLAGIAQVRANLDDFMHSLEEDYYVMQYERMQTNAEDEIAMFYEWIGVPQIVRELGSIVWVKKSNEDLISVINNVDELRAYIQGLELNDICPLMEMLEARGTQAFSDCNHSAVVQKIKTTSFFEDPEIQAMFTSIITSGGRSPRYQASEPSPALLAKVGDLLVPDDTNHLAMVAKKKDKRHSRRRDA